MAIDPTANGRPSAAHVALFEARAARMSLRSGTSASSAARFVLPEAPPPASGRAKPRQRAASATSGASTPARAYLPHTAIESSGASGDPARWDAMLNRLGQKYNVPPLFLKAVMLSESGGRPDAVGDSGHSVGLFQLHDQGYGAGMGDSRFDPEVNADRGVRGLAEAWHAGERAGYTGEYAIRAAYDYSFNPGGGWAYQGDSVVRNYNELRADQGVS